MQRDRVRGGATRARHEPWRQCIGCGRRGPQAEFVRLTVDRAQSPPRVVVATGERRQGRGAYLCHRRSCLDRAVQRRAFQRAFRMSVTVDREDIAAMLTKEAQ